MNDDPPFAFLLFVSTSFVKVLFKTDAASTPLEGLISTTGPTLSSSGAGGGRVSFLSLPWRSRKVIPESRVAFTSAMARFAISGLISKPVSTRILFGSFVMTRAALVIALRDAPCVRTRGGSSFTDGSFEGVFDTVGSSSVVVIKGTARDGKKEGWTGDETDECAARE
jgi:hypothetical protein